MKLSSSFIASSLSYIAAAAVRPSLPADTARLIIAQRLGLSQFHRLTHTDADTIHHINAFGGLSQPLFGRDGPPRSKAHLLVWVEGVRETEATVNIGDGSSHIRGFTIKNPPSPAENDRLVKDIIDQAEALPKTADPQLLTYQSSVKFDAALATPELKPELYNDYLTILRVNKDDTKTHDSLETLLSRVTAMADSEGSSFTVVLMPASSQYSGSIQSTWGDYLVPSAHKHHRRQNPEEFLSAGPEPASSPSPPVSDLEDFPVIASQAETKAPVRGILPNCFDTLSACQKTTNNCTGHGQCKLLHKARGSGKDRQSVDCYGCACSPTVEHVGEDKGMESKRKVTYWGGPACQKKDISVQFWLFVGSGVGLAFLVASGIGMLYSMGSEELPSVIGAGVSGPARK